jgi:predicted metal-binding membrane protein
MALLFVAGVMNVFWIAAIALWVGAEKLLPQGERIARIAGAGLIGWGSVRLALALL